MRLLEREVLLGFFQLIVLLFPPQPNRGTKRPREDDEDELKVRHKQSSARERVRHREEDVPAAEEADEEKKKLLQIMEKGEEEEEEVRLSSWLLQKKCPWRQSESGPSASKCPCRLVIVDAFQRHCGWFFLKATLLHGEGEYLGKMPSQLSQAEYSPLLFLPSASTLIVVVKPQE